MARDATGPERPRPLRAEVRVSGAPVSRGSRRWRSDARGRGSPSWTSRTSSGITPSRRSGGSRRSRQNQARLDSGRYDAGFLRLWEYNLSGYVAGATASDGAVYQCFSPRTTSCSRCRFIASNPVFSYHRPHARVAELADARDLGCGFPVATKSAERPVSIGGFRSLKPSVECRLSRLKSRGVR